MTPQEAHGTVGLIGVIAALFMGGLGAGLSEAKNNSGSVVCLSIAGTLGILGAWCLIKWFLMFFLH